MTGLDYVADALVEVAALVTDFELNVLGEGVDLVIAPPPEALAQMVPFVRDMHASSGLIDELASGTTLEDAQAQVLAYIRQHCPDGSRPPLAGNSVGTDRAFLARDMPELEAFLHYRNVDVSSIKELSRHWYPRAYYNAPAKTGGHRALADIQESIEELRFYREAVFVPPPGPDSEQVRRIAAMHQGALTGATPGAGSGSVAGAAAGAADALPTGSEDGSATGSEPDSEHP
jgi:oligoribonuclease